MRKLQNDNMRRPITNMADGYSKGSCYQLERFHTTRRQECHFFGGIPGLEMLTYSPTSIASEEGPERRGGSLSLFGFN